jgi:hypothetical protein
MENSLPPDYTYGRLKDVGLVMFGLIIVAPIIIDLLLTCCRS